jgi:hypothetical protein
MVWTNIWRLNRDSWRWHWALSSSRCRSSAWASRTLASTSNRSRRSLSNFSLRLSPSDAPKMHIRHKYFPLTAQMISLIFSWLHLKFGVRHYATSRKVAVSISDGVNGFSFNRPNPFSSTMALGSTQPLTEMSTRNLPGGGGGKGQFARKA